MSFLSPLALLWLGSVPVLLWLWRLSSTHRQIHVPSLVPFEHLLRRPARHRTRLFVNVLFWLQLAALIALALALAQPVLLRRRARTTLVVLDTSASMAARLHGASAFEQARGALLARIARKAPTEQFFLITTSPVSALTAQPSADGVALGRLVRALRVSHLGGNLSTSMRMGRALLGTAPNQLLVLTDEPPPPEPLESHTRWVQVGAPLPNIAIVGVDALGPLCAPAQAHLVATLQNFSAESSSVSLRILQGNRRLAEATVALAPRARRSVSLALPEQIGGWVEVGLAGASDALEADDRAWVEVQRTSQLPIVVRSRRSALQDTLSAWLSACSALAWTTEAPSEAPYLLVTDDENERLAAAPPSAILRILPPEGVTPVRSHWIVSEDHPIGAYLSPIGVVAAPLSRSAAVDIQGVPVISALVGGRRTPIVVADDSRGHRVVTMAFDPSGMRDATPVLLVFFNSLRWLMGATQSATTGTPLVLTGFGPGQVHVAGPGGFEDTIEVGSDGLRVDTATRAGIYRFTQGTVEVVRGVNFFDPVESNLIDRVSTWRSTQEPASMPEQLASRAPQPLAQGLMRLLLVLLLVEWGWYAMRHRRRAQGTP